MKYANNKINTHNIFWFLLSEEVLIFSLKKKHPAIHIFYQDITRRSWKGKLFSHLVICISFKFFKKHSHGMKNFLVDLQNIHVSFSDVVEIQNLLLHLQFSKRGFDAKSVYSTLTCKFNDVIFHVKISFVFNSCK